MAAVATDLPEPRAVKLAVARNFLWLSFDKALAIVVGLAVFGAIARAYGPVGSGHYAYALALLQTTLGLSFVCAASAIQPRMCRITYGARGMIANVWLVRVAGTVLATGAVAAFSVIAVDDPQRLMISLIVLATAPLIEPFFIAVTYWQSRNHNKPPVLIRSTGLALRGAFVIGAIALGAPIWVPALAWLLEATITAAMQTASMRALGPLRSFGAAVTRERALTLFRFGVRFQLGLLLSHVFLRTDRLVLAHLMPPEAFGVYATAMQLVEVWLQIATIVGVSIGPAFFYKALQQGRPVSWYARTIAGIACVGLLGVLVTALFGRWALGIVFGPAFVNGYPYLVAGTGFAAMFFVDRAVEMSLTARNRPRTLALKWAVACVTAALVLALLYDLLGAHAGPLGLTLGIVASWIYVALEHRSRAHADATTSAASPRDDRRATQGDARNLDAEP